MRKHAPRKGIDECRRCAISSETAFRRSRKTVRGGHFEKLGGRSGSADIPALIGRTNVVSRIALPSTGPGVTRRLDGPGAAVRSRSNRPANTWTLGANGE